MVLIFYLYFVFENNYLIIAETTVLKLCSRHYNILPSFFKPHFVNVITTTSVAHVHCVYLCFDIVGSSLLRDGLDFVLSPGPDIIMSG